MLNIKPPTGHIILATGNVDPQIQVFSTHILRLWRPADSCILNPHTQAIWTHKLILSELSFSGYLHTPIFPKSHIRGIWTYKLIFSELWSSGTHLEALRKFRKATITFVMSVRLSAWSKSAPNGKNFHEIWWLRIFSKSCAEYLSFMTNWQEK